MSRQPARRMTPHTVGTRPAPHHPATLAPDEPLRPRARGRQRVVQRYQAVIELAPDATVVADAEGHIRLVNRQTEVLFGYAREDLLGQPVETLIPERFHQAHRRHRAAYVAAPSTRPMGAILQQFGRRRDGSEFPVEVSLAPVADEDEVLVIASIRDVSEAQRIRAANQELRRLQAITDTALAHLELDDLLPELLFRVRDVMAVDNAVILLVDADGRELQIRAAHGLEEDVAAGVRVPVGQGFAGRIAASRVPLIVDDLSIFPVVSPFLHEQLRSVVGVPLLTHDQMLGVLHIGTAEQHQFTASDVHLLERVAERVAVAVERAHLYAAEQQARQRAESQATQLRHLQEVTARFAQALSLDQVRRVILADLVRALGARAAGLRLVVGAVLRLDADAVGGRLPPATLRQVATVAVDAAHPAADAVRRGAPLFLRDAAEIVQRYPSLAAAIRQAKSEAVAHLPLTRGDEVFGVLSVQFDEPRTWEASERTFALALASRAALAYERARLFDAEQEARRAAQASEARLRRLVEAGIIGIAVGEGASVREANDAFLRLVGYSRADLAAGPLPVGQRPAEELAVFAEADARARQELLAIGKVTPYEREVLRPDGSRVAVLIGASLLRREPIEWVVYALDMTERKALEHEREQARASELAIRAVNQHLDEFFRTAAHDLRQPIAVAKGRAEMTLRRFERLVADLHTNGGPQAEQAAEVLTTLQQTSLSIDRVSQLALELFDVARARTGTLALRLARLNLAALVCQQVLAQRVATPGRTIQVTVPDDGHPVWVDGDGARLEQVLTNYLSNALKYSAADKPVAVELEVTEGLAVVGVTDQGPGLPWAEQSIVWEMLHRAPGVQVQSGSEGSLGMGLYIVKRLIDLHPGGRVGVESVVGEGSTFWFRLPVADAADAADAASASER